MNEQRVANSIITADIGSTFTHASLLERVNGLYRLVASAEAPSTLNDAESDVTIGLRRALRRIEAIVQRPILGGDDEVIEPETEAGAGVDAFVVTSNAAPPMRCVVIGLADDISVASALRACSSANVFVAEVISLGTRLRRWDAESFAYLQKTPPQVILLVGGLDMGAVAPLENAAGVLATLYRDVDSEERPIIIFAGNQEARRPIADILAPLFDLRVVENVRPTMYIESSSELQRELADVYEEARLATLPGFRRLRRWCTTPVMATAQGLSNTWRYIARRNALSQGVLGLDVGGATTYIGAAREDIYQWAIGADLGTSYGIQRVLSMAEIEDIRRWMPLPLQNDEVLQRLENAWLRPNSIPQSMEDLLLGHAVARQALTLTMQHMHDQYWHSAQGARSLTPSFDLIAARGGTFAHTPQDGLTMLTLLDAIQPVGLVRVVLDGASFWPQLGALATVEPLAAVQVLERDGYRELGTVLSPIGQGREGEQALRLIIKSDAGQVTKLNVPAGTVQRFPLAADEDVTIEVRPSRSFDVGLGQKGAGGKARVRGGTLGLVIDTRGRPLALPRDERYRRLKLQEWLRNLGSDVQRPS